MFSTDYGRCWRKVPLENAMTVENIRWAALRSCWAKMGGYREWSRPRLGSRPCNALRGTRVLFLAQAKLPLLVQVQPPLVLLA
jgi:hypothetical protein